MNLVRSKTEMFPRPRKTRRATALVITVGLLAVLAVIGFGFAVLSRLHHDISKYYRASAQNELVARAAIFYAIREIRLGYANCPQGISRSFQTGAIAEPTDSPQDPWYLDPALATRGYLDKEGTDTYHRYCNLKCNSYSLVHDDLGPRVGVSLIEVLDSAGKLNINDRYNGLESILANLLTKLDDEGLGLLDDPNDPSGGTVSALELAGNIIDRRDDLPNKRFTSLRQLLEKDSDGNFLIEGMDERKYEVLKHYLTIYSWPHQIPSVQGFKPYVVRPFYVAGSSESDSLNTLKRYDSTDPGYPPDHVRSPININTAPEELLVALLSAIKPEVPAVAVEGVAKWILRKRDPENHDLWDNETDWSAWTQWFKKSDGTYTADYQKVLKRQYAGWRAHPLGPFDTWHEVADFLYSLTSDPPRDSGAVDPYANSVLSLAQAETILAATSPNPFASILGHNTWRLAYARLNDTKSPDPDLQAQQCLRDREISAPNLIPTHYGKNDLQYREGDLLVKGDVHPFCFSSMGRHEIYTRTYFFVKADQGVVVSLDDADKPTLLTCTRPGGGTPNWSETPPQWRGYSVLIYDGKGKGILRGIVTNWPNQLAVAQIPFRLSPSGSDQTRFYIVGPPAFVDRVDTATVTEISVSEDKPYILTDTSDDISSEEGEWNGHRIVLYQAETVNRTLPDGSTIQDEFVNRGTIQERIIVATHPLPGGGHELVVSPPFDYDLCELVGAGYHLSYMILGCDGLVEHEAAIKAYDVIHHTTQRDFEQYKAQATRVETGPYPFGTTADPTTDASCKLDGWIALAKKRAQPSDESTFVHNFLDPSSLEPDQGGQYKASSPLKEDMTKAPFDGGRITSDGLILRANDHIDFRADSPPITSGHEDGGFVSFWFRPDETFLSASGTRTLVQVFGSSTTEGQEEDIRLVAGGGQLKVLVRANKEETHSGNIKFRTGDVREYTDANYSDISSWQPGEWHHIAFAWYECDDTKADNDDQNDETPQEDDDTPPGPDQILDDEYKGYLRLWVDGQSSDMAAANEVYAFNLTPPGSGPNIRFGSGISGTIDGIIFGSHSYRNLNLSDPTVNLVPTNPQRYDDTANEGVFESTAIGLNVPQGGEHITLGTVSWTGWLPWCADGERWDQTNSKFPIRVEVALGSSWADAVPKEGADFQSPLGGGGPLRSGSSIIESETATSIRYRVYLRRDFGEAAGGTAPTSKILGRQTPFLDDITITYLGPVVFFFWR